MDARLQNERVVDLREEPLPTHWATKDLENIDFDVIRYYLSKGKNRAEPGTKFRTT